MSGLQDDVAAVDALLDVVWENRQSSSEPRAIVRDRESGRLYHWPTLRAWVGDLRSLQVESVPCEIETLRRDEPRRRDHAQRREANQLRLF